MRDTLEQQKRTAKNEILSYIHPKLSCWFCIRQLDQEAFTDRSPC